jgi:hypothetical protein
MQPNEPGYWDEEKSRRGFVVVVVAVLAVVAVIAPLQRLQQPPILNEAEILTTAETLGDPLPYYSEIDELPPVLPVLVKAVSWIIPLPAGARVLAAILFAVGVALLFLVGRRLWGEAEGVIAALLLLVAPYFLAWSGKAMVELPAVAFSIAAFYLALLAADGRRLAAFFGGLLLAATFLTHWPSVLVGSAVVVLVIAGVLRLRPALFYLAGFVLGVVPYLAWAWIRLGNPVHALLAVAGLTEGRDPATGWASYFASVLLVCAPVALVGLLLYALNLGKVRWKDWARKELPLVVWAVSLPVYLSFSEPQSRSVVTAAVPPLLLVAARGWTATFWDRTTSWRIAAALVGLVAIATQVAGFDTFMLRSKAVDDQRRVSRDMEAAAPSIRETLTPGDVLYSNHLWALLAWWTKTGPDAVWPRDARFSEKFPGNMSRDGIFVHVKGTSKHPREEWLNARPEFARGKSIGRIVIYEFRVPVGTLAREEVKRRLDVARAAYKGGNFEIVVKNLDGFSGGDSGVGCILGWSLYKLGRVEDSARVFGELLDVTPDDDCGLTGSGYAALRLGDPAAADTSFAAVLARKPDSVDALVGSGMAALRQQRHEAAVRSFRRVLELSPGHAEAQEFLARAEAASRRAPSSVP